MDKLAFIVPKMSNTTVDYYKSIFSTITGTPTPDTRHQTSNSQYRMRRTKSAPQPVLINHSAGFTLRTIAYRCILRAVSLSPHNHNNSTNEQDVSEKEKWQKPTRPSVSLRTTPISKKAAMVRGMFWKTGPWRKSKSSIASMQQVRTQMLVNMQ